MTPLLLAACLKQAPVSAPDADAPVLAPRGDVVEELHGVAVADPYRWMEDASRHDVLSWTASENARYEALTDPLPQRAWLYERFQSLWRYDDESVVTPCLTSDRETSWTKAADQDKWVGRMRENPDDAWRVIIDPNTWEDTATLAFFVPSPDCSLAAFAVAHAGDEDPRIGLMDLVTGDLLDDRVNGWRHESVSWQHDSSGFFYSAKPLAEEVAVEGDHNYWHRAWYHTVGTGVEEDQLILHDEEVRETWHGAWISEDGQWQLRSRGLFNSGRVWLGENRPDAEMVPMTDHMDFEYSVDVVEGRAFITTDWDAPNYRVMVADAGAPQQESWTELIPASDDKLSYINLVDGHLYAVYQHNAATRIEVFTLDGEKLHTIPLPTVGSAGVSGLWSKPGVQVSFSSFASPAATYSYDAEANALSMLKPSAMDVDTSQLGVEQVWYPSADGTEVSMFLIRRTDATGPVPTLLTGYGGFNISMTPRFSTRNLVWLEAGGAVAIPNLRGGGEYGRAWHEAGMREKKQNVFDDFIAAAAYLRDNNLADKVAIAGGSNGGLLVSAVVTQRPELFDAVLCQVPLADMVRFHRFGIANIWTEEYGSAEDPEMFPHIYAYSPVHNVVEGTDYPAILVTGSENDARTDPVHARKFMAAAQWADADHGTEEPILLYIQKDSGHGGAVTTDQQADQRSRHHGFLMSQLGLEAPTGG